jgi:hypothetical protein
VKFLQNFTNTSKLVHDFGCADKVIILDKDGRITQQGDTSASFLQEQCLKNFVSDRHSGSNREVADADVQPAAASTPEELGKRDLERQTGDISLYRFYFRSVSLVMTMSWLGLAIIYIGLGRAPRKHDLFRYHNRILIYAVCRTMAPLLGRERDGRALCLLFWDLFSLRCLLRHCLGHQCQVRKLISDDFQSKRAHPQLASSCS